MPVYSPIEYYIKEVRIVSILTPFLQGYLVQRFCLFYYISRFNTVQNERKVPPFFKALRKINKLFQNILCTLIFKVNKFCKINKDYRKIILIEILTLLKMFLWNTL